MWVKQVLDLAANKHPKHLVTDSLQRSSRIPPELTRGFSQISLPIEGMIAPEAKKREHD